MSLIITSNQGTENTPQISNAFKPYSYQNRLLNTMKIPPNSEIALQSAKINKNGLFILDRTNSNFCHYFGTPVASMFNDNIENATQVPFRATIGAGEAFRAGDVKNEVNIQDMVGEIQKGINEAAFHPSLITGVNSTSITVGANYDSSNEVFEGFSFSTTQQTAKTTRNKPDIVWSDISKNQSYTFTEAGGEVTSTDVRGFYIQNRQFPISQNKGEALFNFSQALTGDLNRANFMVGLSRINREGQFENVGETAFLPTYFDTTIRGAGDLLKTPIYPRGQYVYADICVLKYGDELRVYQSGSRTGAGVQQGIYMNEVIYYGAHNTNFNTVYNITTNSDNYEKVKFVLDNEEIQIYMVDAAKNETLLADFKTLQANGAVKNQCINPVNATKWAMYPVMSVARRGGAAHVDQKLSLESIDHYSNYPIYNETTYFNYDWWGWSQEYNQTVFCKELEMRDWNNHSRTVSQHGLGANGLLQPYTVNASGGMTDYDSYIITARSIEYGRTNTEICNTQATLGFLGDPVSRPVNVTLLGGVSNSSSVPKLIANISLFIRLNNFTQNSMNARQGTLSKIIGHLPRFDNSGNETGGLYFEPHEKTYISLNNPTELLVNSFDIDIVYENETLCTALTGKTIVCLHIRASK